MKVLLLGSTGMLGSTVAEKLQQNKNFVTRTTSRSGNNNSIYYDAIKGGLRDLIEREKPNYILNCIGVIKQKMIPSSLALDEETIRVNSVLPFELARCAKEFSAKVIQITTDCVFSGTSGHYSENSFHDCNDLYGRSKSLGEVNSSEVMNLRVSIVGPEKNSHFSLMSWFLNQPKGSILQGYVNHFWNGVTSMAFAKVTVGIIENEVFYPGTFHLVPKNDLSKFDLLCSFAEVLNRKDISIVPFVSPEPINRILTTDFPLVNKMLWNLSDYREIPSIESMLRELSFLQSYT